MPEFGIHVIDTGFMRPGFVASHLVIENGRAAFVDVGASPGIPRLMAALEGHGLSPDQVEWIIVTHVHLDHAGAAGRLLGLLPQARLLVHPRGARHMIDPSRLIAGATAVYGEALMAERFGLIEAADPQRVVEGGDGSVITLGGREFLVLDTPGHARHHFCVCDSHSQGIFTGDTFGLSYRCLDTARGPFIMPSTSPVQFDPVALHASIDRLMGLRPQRMYLTHFGRVDDPAPLAGQLRRDIDDFVAMADAVRDEEQREPQLDILMRSWLRQRLDEHGVTDIDAALAFLDMDIGLNVQGLLCWLDQRQ